MTPAIHRPNPKHVPKQNMVKMLVCRDRRVQNDPQPKHAGKDTAHNRVLLHAAIVCQKPRQQGTRHTSSECPNNEPNPDHPHQGNARKHSMADHVADQRPAFHHQETRQQSRGLCDQQRNPERSVHRLKLKWEKPSIHQATFPFKAATTLRRPTNIPSFGANTQAIKRTRICKQTISPPVAPSRTKLI
ncbi:MAG: hypothetical protein ACI90E_001680 [Yoonia sp.]|jgi:hypothetical protein